MSVVPRCADLCNADFLGALGYQTLVAKIRFERELQELE